MTKIKYPMGTADVITVDAPTAGGHELTIDNNLEIIKLTGLTAATTINFAFANLLEAGARVVLDVVQGATGRNVTLGTGAKAPVLTGVASDRDSIELIYDGTELIATGPWVKTVDAA